MSKRGWITTGIPLGLSENIESFVNSNEGRKSGYTSKTQFVSDAIRRNLERVKYIEAQGRENTQGLIDKRLLL